MAVTVNVPVASIIVGNRRREEYGAVDELAESIKTYGLLHPIVVDIERNLVAGGRRLAAVKQLAWVQVPVRVLDTLSPAELREIELEENLQRKDLTSYELSKNLAELAETAAAIDKESFVQPLDETPTDNAGADNRFNLKQLGPREQPGSIRRVADRIGVAPSEITKARQHVAAVEEHPILKDEPQSTAIDYAKAVKKEPTLQGGLVSSVVGHYRDNLIRQREQAAPAAEVERVMATLPPPPREPDEEKRYRTLIDAIERLMGQNPPDHFADDEPQRWTRDLDSSLKALNEWTDRARKALDNRANRPLRAVK